MRFAVPTVGMSILALGLVVFEPNAVLAQNQGGLFPPNWSQSTVDEALLKAEQKKIQEEMERARQQQQAKERQKTSTSTGTGTGTKTDTNTGPKKEPTTTGPKRDPGSSGPKKEPGGGPKREPGGGKGPKGKN